MGKAGAHHITYHTFTTSSGGPVLEVLETRAVIGKLSLASIPYYALSSILGDVCRVPCSLGFLAVSLQPVGSTMTNGNQC